MGLWWNAYTVVLEAAAERIESSNLSKPTKQHEELFVMIIDASFQFKYSDVTPKWTGDFWKYGGKMYRSLREMKSTVQWKLETKLMKKLSDEIQNEIDKEIIGMLSSFAMNETIKELKKN